MQYVKIKNYAYR